MHNQVSNDLHSRVAAAVLHGTTCRAVWNLIVVDDEFEQRLQLAVRNMLLKNRRQASDDLGQDLASEVRVNLTTKFSRNGPFPWEPQQPLVHWLGTVITNACVEVAPRVFRLVESLSELDSAHLADSRVGVAHSLLNEMRLVRLHQAVASLGPLCAYLLMQVYLSSQKQREVAAALNRSETALANQKQRCLTQLRRYWSHIDEPWS